MSRRYMLDTDISRFVIRGTDVALNRKVASKAGSLCMSAITHHELLYGAKMRDSRRLEETIAALIEVVPVAEFTPEAAVEAARIRSVLDKAGQTIGVMDALIAANAIVEDCTLVTNNIAHFSRIDGLRIENWVGGMKLGLAKGKWQLPPDFDEKFDSADGEVEKHMSGDEPH